jgi:hypothetical protein
MPEASFSNLLGQVDLCGKALLTREWLDPKLAAKPPNRWYQKGGMSRRERRLFMRIRRVAMEAYDKSGVDLVKQILGYLEPVLTAIRAHYVVEWQLNVPHYRPAEDRAAELLCLVNEIVACRKSFSRLVEAGFPHTGFVIILDDMCDEAARVVRREIVRRLIHGRATGTVEVEMLAALQKDLDSGTWETAEEDLDEWLDEDAGVADLWDV